MSKKSFVIMLAFSFIFTVCSKNEVKADDNSTSRADYEDGLTINWMSLSRKGNDAIAAGVDRVLDKLYEYLDEYAYVGISYKLEETDEGIGAGWGANANSAILTDMHYTFLIDFLFSNRNINGYSQCPRTQGQKEQFTQYLSVNLFASILEDVSEISSTNEKYSVDISVLKMYQTINAERNKIARSSGNNRLIGTWSGVPTPEYIELIEDLGIDSDNIYELLDKYGMSTEITFTKDKYSFTLMGSKFTYNYKIEGDTIIVNAAGVEQEIDFEIKDGRLLLSNSPYIEFVKK